MGYKYSGLDRTNSSQSKHCFNSMEEKVVIWLAVELKHQQPFGRNPNRTFDILMAWILSTIKRLPLPFTQPCMKSGIFVPMNAQKSHEFLAVNSSLQPVKFTFACTRNGWERITNQPMESSGTTWPDLGRSVAIGHIILQAWVSPPLQQ